MNQAEFLGVQQCFGVVYHELTMLRQVYFARAALYHDKYIVESLSTTTKLSCYILIQIFKEAKRSVGYHELTVLCACTKGIRELLNL